MAQERETGSYVTPKKQEMTAAERYAYNALPENLRQRKEYVEDTVFRILDLLALIKEFGNELIELGYANYSADGSGTFDPEHVAEREALLGQEFGGELDALLAFDQVKNQGIRRDVGRLGKDFVKKVTALQQLMESLSIRYNDMILPFTRSKGPDLAKFEKELRQRLSDVAYLTHQHSELIAASQDALAGDAEVANDEIELEYKRAVMPFVEEYDALREELASLSRLSFRKRRDVIAKLKTREDAIKAVNKQFEAYPFIDFIAFEIPAEQ